MKYVIKVTKEALFMFSKEKNDRGGGIIHDCIFLPLPLLSLFLYMSHESFQSIEHLSPLFPPFSLPLSMTTAAAASTFVSSGKGAGRDERAGRGKSM